MMMNDPMNERQKRMVAFIVCAMRPIMQSCKRTQSMRIIVMLVDRAFRASIGAADDEFVNASDLADRIGYKFHARLTELRHMGFYFEQRIGKNGLTEYALPKSTIALWRGETYERTFGKGGDK